MSERTLQAEEIHRAVRDRYGEIARDSRSGSSECCGPTDCCDETASNVNNVHSLYETADVAELPFDITGMSLGCGDPVTLAALEPGERVLDLGSGGGIDCFLAAKQVGPSGYVIGVDMTPDMIDKARANAHKMALEHVEFRLAEIEHLPVADGTIDVVISNCVINLSPDKPQVFREAYRALRPGGRLALSDIVTRGPLPPEVREDPDAWASCIAGAWVDEDYLAAVKAAGFVNVQIEERSSADAATADGLDQARGGNDRAAVRGIVYSARVTGSKPLLPQE